MKKGNAFVYIVAVIISAFLLWLWYHHGLNHVDAPLDLILSIIWWVLILVAGYALHRVEKKRQERRRTCFVRRDELFNAEVGTVEAHGSTEVVERIHDLLAEMDYDMHIEDMPEDDEGNIPQYDYVVRSSTFKIKRKEDEEAGRPEELEWEGEVALTRRPDDDPIPFNSREQLQRLLTSLMPA